MTPTISTQQVNEENLGFERLISEAKIMINKLSLPKLNSPVENNIDFTKQENAFVHNDTKEFQTIIKPTSLNLNNFDVSVLQITTLLESLILALQRADNELNQLKLKNLMSSSHSNNDLHRVDVEKNLQKQEYERVKTNLLSEKKYLINKLELKDNKVKKYKRKIVEKNIEINRLARLLNENVIDNINHDISSFDYSNSTISYSQSNITHNNSINHSSNTTTIQTNPSTVENNNNDAILDKRGILNPSVSTVRNSNDNHTVSSLSNSRSLLNSSQNLNSNNAESTSSPNMLRTLGSLATQVLGDDAADTSINRTIILNSNSRLEDDTEAEISFSVNNNNNIHIHGNLNSNNATDKFNIDKAENNATNLISTIPSSSVSPTSISNLADNINNYNKVVNSRNNNHVIGNRLNTVPILSEIRKNVNNEILNYSSEPQLPRMGSFNTISNSFKD